MTTSSSSAAVTPGRILAANTIAFTMCFAVWMMYGALIKFLVESGQYDWDGSDIGLLLATPILTGSLLRLPVGVLTNRFGGRPVFTGVLLVTAAGVLSVSQADSLAGFLAAGLFFGIAGASFAVGVAFTSVWFDKKKQGTALGVFGMGNAGASVTLLGAPSLLGWLTDGGANPEGWRTLPLVYAALTTLTALGFWLSTENKLAGESAKKTIGERLSALKRLQVWRCGMYYFLVFGGFVALSGWLVSYYVDVYGLSLPTAGTLAALFALPSAIIRAAGGVLSDKYGARAVMYAVLGSCVFGFTALCVPLGLLPFAIVVTALGAVMGIGMAAVYKHIPSYFPDEVGVVGGIVGVVGGLGGFVCPIVFGAMLSASKSPSLPVGNPQGCFLFLAVLSGVALTWMHFAIRRMELGRATPVPKGIAIP